MRCAEDMMLLLASAMAGGATASELPRHACFAAARALGCDGASITVNDRRLGRVTLCATDEAVRIVEEAQELVGEGPEAEVFHTGESVTLRSGGPEHGLSDPRWPLLATTPLLDLGPLVVRALPLGPPGRVFGVLTLLQRGVDQDLDEESARSIAKLVTAVVLATAPTAADESMPTPWDQRDEVYQATGMVMAQMRLSEDDALTLLRAHAFAHEIGLLATAREVLQRKLRFSTAAGEDTEP